MTLKDFILSILAGSFALGPIIFAACERIAAFGQLNAEAKRWVVAAASGIVGVAAWAIALWLGYVDQPTAYTPDYVLSSVWTYGVLTGYSAFTSASLLHGRIALKK